jgi:ferredoxin
MLVIAGVAGVDRARALTAARSSGPCPARRPRPAAPPGAGSVARLNRTCTACQLCVAACPTRVLQPAFLQFGLAGLLQPRLDYAAAYCDYECVRCGEVCPTGAIRALSAAAKKRVQVGRVRFVEDLCIVVTEWTACGACAEHCPTGAVHMVPYEGDLTLPKLDNDVCVGCGACEHACPVVPIRAIVVDGEPVHLTAAPPRETRPPVHAPEDFPF